jgi:hypothetical protein
LWWVVVVAITTIAHDKITQAILFTTIGKETDYLQAATILVVIVLID